MPDPLPDDRKGSATVAVRYSGELVTCTACGDRYQARSFEPISGSLCDTCRLSRQDTVIAGTVPLDDIVTARILAESFGVSVQRLVGIARALWEGLTADDRLTFEQEQRLITAAEAMACEY